MDEPQPFRWTYDRSPWDDRAGATTFSVGVYQWLPKASGRGLKKSTAIRVNGYVADAAAVYAKADELCERFNREDVRLDRPPAWLQKSYAVAKPADFERPRRSTDLTAAEARVIRNRVVKPLLRAAGYEQTHASTFANCRDGLVRLLNFQTSSGGAEFTVNLGWHPTFVPVVGYRPEQMPWTRLEAHQCAVSERIGHLLPERKDTWWPFKTDAESLAATCAEVANRAVEGFEEYSRQPEVWCDPSADNRALPPHAVIGYPTTLRACLAMWAGRLDEAEVLLAAEIRDGVEEMPEWHEELLGIVGQLRAAAGDLARTRNITTWLTA